MVVGQPFDTVKVSMPSRVCILTRNTNRYPALSLWRVTPVQLMQHSRTGQATDGRVGREESVQRNVPLLLTYGGE